MRGMCVLVWASTGPRLIAGILLLLITGCSWIDS